MSYAEWMDGQRHSSQFFLFCTAPTPPVYGKGTARGLVHGYCREMVKSVGFEVRHTRIQVSALPHACCMTEANYFSSLNRIFSSVNWE